MDLTAFVDAHPAGKFRIAEHFEFDAHFALPIRKQRAIALGVVCPTFNTRPAQPWDGGLDLLNLRHPRSIPV